LNPWTPTGQGPEPCAVGLAWLPSQVGTSLRVKHAC